MHIERVTVEEGFLDGLDLTLSPGLNVLIGARGTGKSSIIELIRFCLGAPTFTQEARTRSGNHVSAVLGTGVVAVTLTDGSEQWTISRQLTDEQPQGTVPITATVLAQSEIEAVGSQSRGRMHLLDRGRPDGGNLATSAGAMFADLESVTAEIGNLLREIDAFEERRGSLSETPKLLATALEAQDQGLKAAAATVEERQALETLQTSAERFASQLALYEHATERIEAFRDRVENARAAAPVIDPWPKVAGPEDLLSEVRAAVVKAQHYLAGSEEALTEALALVAGRLRGARAERSVSEERARALRRRLSEVEEGVGLLTRRVNELRESQAQLSTLAEQLSVRRKQLEDLWSTRAAAYKKLEAARQLRFEERAAIVAKLNEALRPTIRLRLEQSAKHAAYVDAIIAALQGSGLHYNTLAPRIAARVSPLELLFWAESADPDALVAATEITRERAVSLVDYLRRQNNAAIISAPIEDDVVFELLDGSDYKRTEHLSIGQRCTVVLPVLLSQPGDVLVIDQPEDHLDNAYVTSTLVERLRRRQRNQQMIVSSHNPNIPVLGDADRVVQLASDGIRGYVACAGSLSDREVVEAVTSVMEGGVKAFAQRAAFYGDLIPASGGSR